MTKSNVVTKCQNCKNKIVTSLKAQIVKKKKKITFLQNSKTRILKQKSNYLKPQNLKFWQHLILKLKISFFSNKKFDTLTIDKIYSGKHFAILRCFIQSSFLQIKYEQLDMERSLFEYGEKYFFIQIKKKATWVTDHAVVTPFCKTSPYIPIKKENYVILEYFCVCNLHKLPDPSVRFSLVYQHLSSILSALLFHVLYHLLQVKVLKSLSSSSLCSSV